MKNWRDVYKLPLELNWGRVYDADRNFVFQFETGSKYFQEYILEIINGEREGDPTCRYKYENEQVIDCFGIPILLMRGWGNLTGIGGFNLPGEEAANIQDTFGEFIADRLNFNKDLSPDQKD